MKKRIRVYMKWYLFLILFIPIFDVREAIARNRNRNRVVALSPKTTLILQSMVAHNYSLLLNEVDVTNSSMFEQYKKVLNVCRQVVKEEKMNQFHIDALQVGISIIKKEAIDQRGNNKKDHSSKVILLFNQLFEDVKTVLREVSIETYKQDFLYIQDEIVYIQKYKNDESERKNIKRKMVRSLAIIDEVVQRFDGLQITDFDFIALIQASLVLSLVIISW